MQTKLIEILSKATGWLPANKIAEIGEWRSAANVGVALGQMEKAGRTERRKSPTIRMHNGMPATEWKLVEKVFPGDKEKAAAKAPESSPVEQQVSQGLEMFNLRQQLAHAEKMRDAHFESAETAAKRIDELVAENRAIAEDRDRYQRMFNAACVDLGLINESLELDPNDGGAEPIIDAIKNLHAFLNQTGEQADALRSERDKLRKECDELFIKLGNMEIEQEQSKDVTEAAVGYIVRVAGRKPRICAKPESARTAALASARAHGRADVLALVPVGKAVRGAEWKEAA